jgi:DNA modification methylase
MLVWLDKEETMTDREFSHQSSLAFDVSSPIDARKKPKNSVVKAKEKGLKPGDKVGQFGTFEGDRGVYDSRNDLNDLTGKEWVQFTRSWTVHNPPSRTSKEVLHPAKFPETLIAEFISFFTKKGETVLDPMLGTGSTLVACKMTNRRGIGIELSKKWADIARDRSIHIDTDEKNPKQIVIEGDARHIKKLLLDREINSVDFCITSPPYWNMLKKSRGHVKSESKKREEIGLDTYYSESPHDYGNIDKYDAYLSAMYDLFAQVFDVLRDQRYLVVIAQNILTPEGEMVPLAWDLARKLSNLYVLKQEKLWMQDNKMLGSWGYPFEYVSNVHHHYCLVFKKDLTKRSGHNEDIV